MSSTVIGPTLTDGTVSLVPTYTFNADNRLASVSVGATSILSTIALISTSGPTGTNSGSDPWIFTLTNAGFGPFEFTFLATTSTTLTIANGTVPTESNYLIAYTSTKYLSAKMPIQFDHGFGSVLANTKYYVGVDSTCTGSVGSYTGQLYVSSTSNGTTYVTLGTTSDTTIGTVKNSFTTKVAGYNLTSDFIFVDTSAYPSLIVFPNPVNFPVLLNKKAIFVKDKSWNASVNNITIQSSGGARIEEKTRFVLSQNGECLSLFTDSSEYFISSIYPSKNCGLMGTIDATNAYNTPELKGIAVVDKVNIFNTDNTPEFDLGGNIVASTTKRQSNTNVVYLPTTIPSNGSMCMIIYAGGLSGKRHTYPLAIHGGSTNDYTTSKIDSTGHILFSSSSTLPLNTIVSFSVNSLGNSIFAQYVPISFTFTGSGPIGNIVKDELYYIWGGYGGGTNVKLTSDSTGLSLITTTSDATSLTASVYTTSKSIAIINTLASSAGVTVTSSTGLAKYQPVVFNDSLGLINAGTTYYIGDGYTGSTTVPLSSTLNGTTPVSTSATIGGTVISVPIPLTVTQILESVGVTVSSKSGLAKYQPIIFDSSLGVINAGTVYYISQDYDGSTNVPLSTTSDGQNELTTVTTITGNVYSGVIDYLSVTATIASGGGVTISNGSNTFHVGDPIIFAYPFNVVSANTMYYIGSTYNHSTTPTTIPLSTTPDGLTTVPTTEDTNASSGLTLFDTSNSIIVNATLLSGGIVTVLDASNIGPYSPILFDQGIGNILANTMYYVLPTYTSGTSIPLTSTYNSSTPLVTTTSITATAYPGYTNVEVTATLASSAGIVVSNAGGIFAFSPIVFEDTRGGIIANVTYYVASTYVSGTTVPLSTTSDGLTPLATTAYSSSSFHGTTYPIPINVNASATLAAGGGVSVTDSTGIRTGRPIIFNQSLGVIESNTVYYIGSYTSGLNVPLLTSPSGPTLATTAVTGNIIGTVYPIHNSLTASTTLTTGGFTSTGTFHPLNMFVLNLPLGVLSSNTPYYVGSEYTSGTIPVSSTSDGGTLVVTKSTIAGTAYTGTTTVNNVVANSNNGVTILPEVSIVANKIYYIKESASGSIRLSYTLGGSIILFTPGSYISTMSVTISPRIDGIQSPYTLTNAPFIATGNTSMRVVSTISPNIVKLESLSGITPLMPITFNYYSNGLVPGITYYVMFGYNQLTDGNNVPLSLTYDGSVPLTNIANASLATTAYAQDFNVNGYGILTKLFDNALYPGQIEVVQVDDGDFRVGFTITFDTDYLGVQANTTYIVDEILDVSTDESGTKTYRIALSIGFNGVTPILWSGSGLDKIVPFTINYSLICDLIPLNVLGTIGSFQVKSIIGSAGITTVTLLNTSELYNLTVGQLITFNGTPIYMTANFVKIASIDTLTSSFKVTKTDGTPIPDIHYVYQDPGFSYVVCTASALLVDAASTRYVNPYISISFKLPYNGFQVNPDDYYAVSPLYVLGDTTIILTQGDNFPISGITNQRPLVATILDGDNTKSTGALFISDDTTWYSAGWYDPTNWTWDTTIPTDSADYFNIPTTDSQIALTISPNVNSFVNLPKELPVDLTSYWTGDRSMPYFIIAKNTAISRSKLGFSTYVQGNSNMFNDNATLRIYWVGSKVTNRPCIWFVSEIRPNETHIRYYPMLGYSP